MGKLGPGQTKTYKDKSGGTDLVVDNPGPGKGTFTYAVDDGPAKPHSLHADGSWTTEVADGQEGTLTNTGTVMLNVKFGGIS